MIDMPNLFSKIFKNFIAIFSGYNLLFHLLAIIVTYISLSTGFDWYYFVITQKTLLGTILFPALILGGLLPIFVPIALYIIGKLRKNPILIVTAFAVGQAAILGSVISSLYKAFTGRIQPSWGNTLTDISHVFQFGFLRHGIFWGWPSSHTTIAFAMAFTLVIIFRKNKIISVVALAYALYIGLGVSISIHWFSEFIAGALIGSCIGIVVGKTFLKLKR
jgi:membrane-associated phospholipid phosphatase